MKYVAHTVILRIGILVKSKQMTIVYICIALIEHTQYPVKMTVELTMKERYLNYDAVVLKTVNKRIRNTFLYFVTGSVTYIMTDINKRLIYIAKPVAKNVYSNHWQRILFSVTSLHIALVAVLRSEILSEAECFCLKPRFLKFYQYMIFRTVLFLYRSCKVETEHGYAVTGLIAVLMRADRHFLYVLIEQCRQYRLCNALIFH